MQYNAIIAQAIQTKKTYYDKGINKFKQKGGTQLLYLKKFKK